MTCPSVSLLAISINVMSEIALGDDVDFLSAIFSMFYCALISSILCSVTVHSSRTHLTLGHM